MQECLHKDMMLRFVFRLPLKRYKKRTNREISCCEEYHSKKTQSNVFLPTTFLFKREKTNAAIKGKDSQNRRLCMVQF